MRGKKVPFCNIKLERKNHRHQAFDKWPRHIIALPGMKKLLNDLGILRAINQARVMIVKRNPTDLEFLMSRWTY